jgi:hypothetical protein
VFRGLVILVLGAMTGPAAATVPAMRSTPAPTPIAAAAPPTTPVPTTVAPFGDQLPVSPSTLPLTTKRPSAHVDPIFAMLSGVGFFVAVVILVAQFVLTRPGRRRRRWTL